MAKQRTPAAVGTDWLVTGADAAAPLAERAEWLAHLAAWVRSSNARDGAGSVTPATRLKFFLQVLERHPDRRDEVGRLVRATLLEMDAIGLLSDTGLPRAHALFQELAERISRKLLPSLPAPNDLAGLFGRLFPDERDADWVGSLPPETLRGLTALLSAGVNEGNGAGVERTARDAADALMILASHVQAIGLSHRVRRRTAVERPLDSPFAALTSAVRDYVEAQPGSADADEARAALGSHIARCARGLADVSGHLENYGVSTDLVYQLERARLSLARMSALVAFRAPDGRRPRAVAQFVASLIRANAAQTSVRALLSENSFLLARRIVESARKTGEHYITRDFGEYRAMLASAAIGGALTGVTVTVKLVTTGHGLPPFIEGLVASLNYALSFVLIHLLHGTLATKQPAMTAATMADHLNNAHERDEPPPARIAEREARSTAQERDEPPPARVPEREVRTYAHARGRMRGFVSEVANLVRSQVAAIAGNLLLVVPAALLLQACLLFAGFGHVPDHEDARKYIGQLSFLGSAPFYAAITGVLLWLSALFAGWFENWATYRRLPEAIGRSAAAGRWLGRDRAARFAAALERNVAALGGNVSLGFLLGMVPVIALFFGLPVEVRHVTLSTGQLALAAWAEGAGVFALPAFWLAVVGIGVIGFMNLTVSFVLAMWLAIRSTGRGAVSRRRLTRAVLAHLLAAPRDFLLPPRAAPAHP